MSNKSHAQVLAMRRFFGMLYRVNNRINELINVLVVIIIWAMATTVMAPYGVFTKFSEHANRFYMIYFGIDGGTFCSEDWPNSTTTATYRISIFMVHFAFPVMILGALYLFLKHEQSQRSRSFITHDATSAQETGAQGHELERQAFDNTYMIIKAVVLLHLFWAPLVRRFCFYDAILCGAREGWHWNWVKLRVHCGLKVYKMTVL